MSWTFLSNHGHVLVHISRNPEARLRDIAADVGITERAVQIIVRNLLDEGYLKVVKVGRRNTYKINKRAKLRHQSENQNTIDDLLSIFDD
jgi:predicted transcriptional regulator